MRQQHEATKGHVREQDSTAHTLKEKQTTTKRERGGGGGGGEREREGGGGRGGSTKEGYAAVDEPFACLAAQQTLRVDQGTHRPR